MTDLGQLMRATARAGVTPGRPKSPEVSTEDMAARAWRAGRRRRLASGMGTGAVLVATLTLVLSAIGVFRGPTAGVPAAPPSGSSAAGPGVTSHPQRLAHQWWVPGISWTRGPVAGLVHVLLDGDSGASTWQAFDADGRRFTLPTSAERSDVFPAVSPDGRRIAWLGGDAGPWIVRDLASGRETHFAYGDANLTPGADSFASGLKTAIPMQFPAFFNPSGERLAISAQIVRSTGAIGQEVRVLSQDGSERSVPDVSMPWGWTDEDHLLGWASAGRAPLGPGVHVVSWDARSGKTSPMVTVDVSRVGGTSIMGQWGASVRADGTLGMVVTATGGDLAAGFDLRTGQVVPIPWNAVDPAQPTRLPTVDSVDLQERSHVLSWRADRPVGFSSDGHAVVDLSPPSERVVTAVDPSIPVLDVLWARDALQGPPSWTLLGTNDAAPLWWWSEASLGVLLIVALRALRARRRAAGGAPAAYRRRSGRVTER